MEISASSIPPRPTVAPQSETSKSLENYKDQGAGTEKKPTESFMQRTFDDPVAVFTLWLAVATTGLWLFTAKLWRATAKAVSDAESSGITQADKMERSIAEAARAAKAMESVAVSIAANSEQIIESVNLTRRAMRAYISVVIGTAVYQDTSLVFEARPRILNRGNTEARNVRWKIAADILPIPIPSDFKYPLPKEYAGGSVIGSQLDGFISGLVPRRVPDKDVANIKKANGMALTVWGYVIYKDIFGKTHRTTFTQQLHWLQSGRKPLFGEAPQTINGHFLSKHNRSN